MKALATLGLLCFGLGSGLLRAGERALPQTFALMNPQFKQALMQDLEPQSQAAVPK